MASRADRAARFERAHSARLPLGANGVIPGAEPLRLSASPTHAVLLLHGYNDTPQSVAPIASMLHAAGWTVVAPLLPGHGRDLQYMASASRGSAWLSCARTEYQTLRASHTTVALCGLSMGGALCALLAAEHQDVPALVLLAPYLGMPWRWQAGVALAWVRWLFNPYVQGSGGERSIHDPVARARALGPGVHTAHTLTGLRAIARAAEQRLSDIRSPTLYLQSKEDNRVRATDAIRHFRMIGSTVREQHWLSGCGHIITADYCKDDVGRRLLAWIDAHAGLPSKET